MSYKDFTALSAKALLLLTFTASILLAGCKSQKVQSHWSAQPVQVDGEMTEWADMPTTYFEDSGVQLGLCNDSENLYVLFRFSDQTWARAIRMGGLTLWLDNSGKKKKDFGIRYTGGPPLSEMERPGMAGEGGFWDSLPPEQKQRLMQRRAAMADQIIFIDKKRDREITLPVDGSSGPAVRSAIPQGIFTYEFSIPLKQSDDDHYGIGTQPGQTISLGLEWGGIDNRRRGMQEMGGRMPGGPPDEGGMPPGGRSMGRGQGRPPGGFPPQPPEKQEVWMKTLLASPPVEQGEEDNAGDF